MLKKLGLATLMPTLKDTLSPDEVRVTGDEPSWTLFSDTRGGRMNCSEQSQGDVGETHKQDGEDDTDDRDERYRETAATHPEGGPQPTALPIRTLVALNASCSHVPGSTDVLARLSATSSRSRCFEVGGRHPPTISSGSADRIDLAALAGCFAGTPPRRPSSLCWGLADTRSRLDRACPDGPCCRVTPSMDLGTCYCTP